jgi:hypothetical protein
VTAILAKQGEHRAADRFGQRWARDDDCTPRGGRGGLFAVAIAEDNAPMSKPFRIVVVVILVALAAAFIAALGYAIITHPDRFIFTV